MPKRKNSRNAAGGGSIRQRKDGTWEGRYTTGRDPGTGKQIRKSVYGATQKEVRQKLQQATTAIDEGIYMEPSKITVGKWLDTWLAEYCGGLKPLTLYSYGNVTKNRIKPALGAVRLAAITAPEIQAFYNRLHKEGLSPKTIKRLLTILLWRQGLSSLLPRFISSL